MGTVEEKKQQKTRHGKNISFDSLFYQCKQHLYYLARLYFPWLQTHQSSPKILQTLEGYRSKIFYMKVRWSSLSTNQIKGNTDGACKGNPRQSAYVFCLRDHYGNLIYTEAGLIGIKSNLEAEIIAILKCLKYCQQQQIPIYQLEITCLRLTKIIRRE